MAHLKTIKCILRFLKGTQHSSLRYLSNSLISLWFSDVDWAGCPTLRRITIIVSLLEQIVSFGVQRNNQ